MIRLGIIGTGKIVNEALYAMEPVKEITKQAIFARPHSVEKAKRFAEGYGIPKVYTDYTKLLQNPDIDAVYIGLVNSVHYDYAKEALLHGKHVLLEKPFVLSSKEAEELRMISEERGLILMEAITVLHNPVFEEMKRKLPKLGSVKLVLCNYSQYSSRYDGYLKGEIAPAFNPELQGGAVYDLNVYNIHYCVGLFGMPDMVHYFPNRGFNGVDTSGALVMTYRDGFQCVCTAAKDSDSPGFVSIQGEKGWMKTDGKPNAASSLETVYVDDEHFARTQDASGAMVRKTLTEIYQSPEPHHRMTKEFTDFAEIIGTKDTQRAEELLDESVNVVRVLEMCKAGSEGVIKRKNKIDSSRIREMQQKSQ